jgi:hypothetical protein
LKVQEAQVAMTAKQARKYQILSGIFFRGSWKAHLHSIFKDREFRLNRDADFKLALKNCDISMPQHNLPNGIWENWRSGSKFPGTPYCFMMETENGTIESA